MERREKIDSYFMWLESEEGMRAFFPVCHGIVRRVDLLNLPEEVWPVGRLKDAVSPEDRQEIFQTGAAEVYAYLKEFWIKRHGGSIKVQHRLSLGQYRDVLHSLQLEFISHLLDRSRGKNVNLFQHIYKRTCDEMRRSSAFFTQSEPRFIYYSLEEHAPHLADISTLADSETGYISWPDPRGIAHDENFFANPGENGESELRIQGQVLLDLAAFFWKEAMKRLRGNYYLPVREFVRYLDAHYAWITPIRGMVPYEENDSMDDREPDDESIGLPDSVNSGIALTDWPMTAEKIPNLFEDRMDDLAAQLAASWSRAMKVVFCLRLEEPPVSRRAIQEQLHQSDRTEDVRTYERRYEQSLAGFFLENPIALICMDSEKKKLQFLECIRKICCKTVAESRMA